MASRLARYANPAGQNHSTVLPANLHHQRIGNVQITVSASESQWMPNIYENTWVIHFLNAFNVRVWSLAMFNGDLTLDNHGNLTEIPDWSRHAASRSVAMTWNIQSEKDRKLHHIVEHLVQKFNWRYIMPVEASSARHFVKEVLATCVQFRVLSEGLELVHNGLSNHYYFHGAQVLSQEIPWFDGVILSSPRRSAPGPSSLIKVQTTPGVFMSSWGSWFVCYSGCLDFIYDDEWEDHHGEMKIFRHHDGMVYWKA